ASSTSGRRSSAGAGGLCKLATVCARTGGAGIADGAIGGGVGAAVGGRGGGVTAGRIEDGRGAAIGRTAADGRATSGGTAVPGREDDGEIGASRFGLTPDAGGWVCRS